MKGLLFLAIASTIFTGCSKSPEKSKPEIVFNYEAGTGVFTGVSDLGEVKESKLVTLSLKNTGDAPLVGPAQLDNSNFSIITQNGCNSISPKNTCSIKVSFSTNGKAPGLYESNLNLDSVFVTLKATIPAPVVSNVITFSAPELDYGSMMVSQVVTKSLTITNKGSQPVNQKVNITGSAFKIIYDTCSNKSVAVNKSCSLKITNQPVAGVHEETLSYNGSSLNLKATISDPHDEPELNYELTYLQNNQVVASVDAGEVMLPNLSKQVILYLKNSGSASLPLSQIQLNNTNFSVAFDQCSGKSLPVNTSCQVRLVFSASGKNAGIYNSSLSYGTFSLPVKGEVLSNVAPVVCSLENALGNGLTTLSEVVSVKGSLPNCLVNSCTAGFVVSGAETQCQLDTRTCQVLDAEDNGVNFLNSNFAVTGNLSGLNKDNCLLADNACNSYFSLSADKKSCQPIGCDLSNMGQSQIVPSIQISQVTGYLPNCQVSTCSEGYLVSGDSLSCQMDTRPCALSDALSNNVQIANSNSQIVGNMAGLDSSACVLASNACNNYFSLSSDSKSCQAISCSLANMGQSSIIPSIKITEVSGTLPNCTVESCESGYIVATNRLSCEEDVPPINITSSKKLEVVSRDDTLPEVPSENFAQVNFINTATLTGSGATPTNITSVTNTVLSHTFIGTTSALNSFSPTLIATNSTINHEMNISESITSAQSPNISGVSFSGNKLNFNVNASTLLSFTNPRELGIGINGYNVKIPYSSYTTKARLNLGEESPYFYSLVGMNSDLYVIGELQGEDMFMGEPVMGKKLFKISSNGVAQRISNINSDILQDDLVGSGINSMIVFNGELYFQGVRNNLSKLFKYNPQTHTISQMSNINIGGLDRVGDFIVFKNELYFKATNSSNHYKLYKINSLGNITQVTNICSGCNENINYPTVAGNYLYFLATYSGSIFKLYRTDGTVVQQVSNFNGAASDGSIYPLGAFKNYLYLRGGVGTNYKLYRIGDSGIMEQVSNTNPGGSDGAINNTQFAITDNYLYFAANISGNYLKLFRTDISKNVTQVGNIKGAAADYYGNLKAVGNRVYMVGSTSANKQKLFQIKDSESSVKEISNLNPSGSDMLNSAIVYNNELYFSSYNQNTQLKLFKFSEDGRITQLSNIDLNNHDNINFIQEVDGRIYFKAAKQSAGLIERIYELIKNN